MARTVRDSKLDSRTARLRLSAKKEPYWRSIDQGIHLGYYKGTKGATWVARFRNNNGKYSKTTLGKTDDISDADGITFLNYSQAQEKAREWFSKQGKLDAGIIEHKGRYTVAHAAEEYLTWFQQNRRSFNETLRLTEKHIISELGKIEVTKLSTNRIRDWLNGLVTKPPKTRSGKPNKALDLGDPETIRKRKCTANRILTVLKAILNHAYREGRVDDDSNWRRVKAFEKVDQAKIQFLDKEEIARLLNATEGNFKKLVQGALLTGARYGELTRLTCADYHKDSATVYLHETKSGKPRHVHLNDEGMKFFDSITAGLAKNEFIFKNEDGTPLKKSHQFRPMKAACKNAKITPEAGFHVLRHTYASHLAMAGTPLNVIATQLGHSDTRICEKHYAHLSPDYIKRTVQENLPSFGITHETNVTRLASTN